MHKSEVEIFCEVSRVLTGVAEINTRLAAIYLDRIRQDPDAAKSLAAFLATAVTVIAAPMTQREELARVHLVDAPGLAPVTRRIIVLWYTGHLPTAADPSKLADLKTPEEYFGALMWSVMGAHPPGLSGGYFGYWRYPPEN